MSTRTASTTLAAALIVLTACRTVIKKDGGDGGDGGGGAAPVLLNKVDVLLAIDNSSSMAEKQALLAEALPDLVDRLVNPRCVNANGASQSPPAALGASCATGFSREFLPVTDINIGVVSSSLGALGADQCAEDAVGHHNDDRGELLSRTASGSAETYAEKGFLAWDPAGTRSPPGETSEAALTATLRDMVAGVDETGCGYEMPLEGIYRFLVDPKPYLKLTKLGSNPYEPTTPEGIDQTILDQRANFLRPDSIVAIVVLSDEDDCSVRPGAQYYSVLNMAPFYKAASACAADPNDDCCYSCGLSPPAGCEADPACAGDPKYAPPADSVNLRCWSQKRRYGFDALFPTARYVNALSQSAIDPNAADLVPFAGDQTTPNPLFVGGRTADSIFVAGIVGVPWQVVATDPNDVSKGLATYDALTASGFWETYVGDPDQYVEPTAGIMQEDFQARPGVTATSPNGGDRTIDAVAPNDLQYACIFPLKNAIPNGPNCADASPDNPICQGTTEINAKAYPGLRELAVLRGMGTQGITASICPADVTNPEAAGYGYRPVVATLVDRMKTKLAR